MEIVFSAKRRSSFALGSVVVMRSCSISEVTMLRNMAARWDELRLSLRPVFWWRMG